MSLYHDIFQRLDTIQYLDAMDAGAIATVAECLTRICRGNGNAGDVERVQTLTAELIAAYADDIVIPPPGPESIGVDDNLADIIQSAVDEAECDEVILAMNEEQY